MTRRRSQLAATRGTLYGVARLIGNVRAVQTGRVGQRLVNRAIGRRLGRLFLR